MKTSFIILLSLALTLGCKTGSHIPSSEEKSSYIHLQSTLNGGFSSTFTGHVKELRSKEPIPSAQIELTKSDGTTFRASTNEWGKFTLKSVPLGSYRMEITGSSYDHVDINFTIEQHADYTVDARLSQILLEKPVIYLYPTQKQNVSLTLNYKGTLTHSYPTYSSKGWNVTAEPNGTLWDENGMEYYALFWEGVPERMIVPGSGFVIAGKETAAFLEEKLAFLGLNRREANEFIMYWLPRMENNAYNFVHFAGKQYEEQAELMVDPKPETSIRVMMLTQPLHSKIDFPLQDLSSLKKSRKGFTLVEWGGAVITSIREDV